MGKAGISGQHGRLHSCFNPTYYATLSYQGIQEAAVIGRPLPEAKGKNALLFRGALVTS